MGAEHLPATPGGDEPASMRFSRPWAERARWSNAFHTSCPDTPSRPERCSRTVEAIRLNGVLGHDPSRRPTARRPRRRRVDRRIADRVRADEFGQGGEPPSGPARDGPLERRGGHRVGQPDDRGNGDRRRRHGRAHGAVGPHGLRPLTIRTGRSVRRFARLPPARSVTRNPSRDVWHQRPPPLASGLTTSSGQLRADPGPRT